MDFETFGPYELIVRRDNGKFDIGDFWSRVREDIDTYREGDDIRYAIGCYIFGIRYDEKITPHYVGSTCAQTGFYGEIFQKDKRNHYHQTNKKRGAPVMFLFPMVTPTRRDFVSSSGNPNPTILWLEKLLITLSLRKNTSLRNLRDTRYLREAWVEGVLGVNRRGRLHRGAQSARNMLLL